MLKLTNQNVQMSAGGKIFCRRCPCFFNGGKVYVNTSVNQQPLKQHDIDLEKLNIKVAAPKLRNLGDCCGHFLLLRVMV